MKIKWNYTCDKFDIIFLGGGGGGRGTKTTFCLLSLPSPTLTFPTVWISQTNSSCHLCRIARLEIDYYTSYYQGSLLSRLYPNQLNFKNDLRLYMENFSNKI